MILHYIPKDQLRANWQFIKHGLEIIRSKGSPEWIFNKHGKKFKQ